MRVRDLMTSEVASVRRTDHLDRAVRHMERRNCGTVPVVDDDERVVGMVTDRDVCLTALRTDRPLSALAVEEAMSRELFACGPDDTIDEVERVMGLHQIRRMPVVGDGGKLVGILSLDDIAREAYREEDLFAPPVSEQAVGRTLGQISRPHLIQGGGF